MARAIRAHYVGSSPGDSAAVHENPGDVTLVVDARYGPYERRIAQGFHVYLDPLTSAGKRRDPFLLLVDFMRVALSSRLLPASTRDALGIANEESIDAVLDASGFAYSDQWGMKPLVDAMLKARRWKRQGKKLVLMPQAFGPFRHSGTALVMRKFIDCVDLVYARDMESYEHLTRAVGRRDYIRVAPDFTTTLKGQTPSNGRSNRDYALIIPNYRMIDKVDRDSAAAYKRHLIACVEEVRSRGLEPMVLYFTPEDRKIMPVLGDQALRVQEVLEDDPLILKGIISRAKVVIGSRFHALVSALSQGVPAIATGWSHKYRHLFDQYQSSRFLLTVDNIEDIGRRLDEVCDESSRQNMVRTLCLIERGIRQEVDNMWQEIDDLLFGDRNK